MTIISNHFGKGKIGLGTHKKLGPQFHYKPIDKPAIDAIIKIEGLRWIQDCAINVLLPIAPSKRDIGNSARYL
jgi:hypothetical protein